MAWAKRVDSTHAEIADALRKAGWQVEQTFRLPNFVDLVAWKGDTVRLIDAKSKGGKPTDSQRQLLARGCPIVFLQSAEDAVRLR